MSDNTPYSLIQCDDGFVIFADEIAGPPSLASARDGQALLFLGEERHYLGGTVDDYVLCGGGEEASCRHEQGEASTFSPR